jgi:hypothetical protein
MRHALSNTEAEALMNQIQSIHDFLLVMKRTNRVIDLFSNALCSQNTHARIPQKTGSLHSITGEKALFGF